MLRIQPSTYIFAYFKTQPIVVGCLSIRKSVLTERNHMNLQISESEFYKAVRMKEAAEILGISEAMVFKLLATDKQFPKGSKLGKARVWHKGDLLSYMIKRKDR